MSVNEVVYNGETLIDLKSDTVTPETLAEGVTAHDASGEKIVGTMTTKEQLAAGDYPDYVRIELERVASEVRKVLTDESIVSICLSDSHYPADENTRLSGLHAAMAIKGLTYLLPVDFIAHLGDVGYEGSSQSDTTLLESNTAEMMGFVKEMAGISIPLFVAIGNHDNGNYVTTSDSTDMVDAAWLYNNFTALSASDDTVIAGADVGGYCYRDFESKKLRVFLLNTGEGIVTGGYSNDTGASATQLAWFAAALQKLNTKSDASEWKIIVLCHYPADYGAARPLSNVLAAYVGGTSITLNGKAYNFSGANSARFLVQHHGHIHNYLVDRLYTGDTPVQYNAYRVGIPNTQHNRENYYGTFNSVPYSEAESYAKTPDTAEDTSFVVNVYNPSEEMIYSIHYGAGYDRAISLKDVVYYSIQADLTGATLSGSGTTVQEGESYTGTVTITDGYELESVVVTMGGEDVTDSVYADGVITIPEVTGTVVITVAAVAPPENLIPLSLETDGSLYNGGLGYKSGYRLSTSGSGEKTLAGSYISGFIPVDLANETLTLHNIGTADVSYVTSYMIGFNSLSNSAVNGQLDLASLTANADGSLTIPAGTFNADLTAVKYVRLSCSYIGSDSAVYKS